MHLNLPLVRLAVALIVAALITTGVPGRSVPGRAATASVTSGGATHTVWLCRLGQADNPCTANLDTAVAHRDGTITVKHVAPTANSGFDCFYVYPTVSTERQDNADLRVQAAEITAARAQASRFSQVCKVWAPMYRQATLYNLHKPGPDGHAEALATAYKSLFAGWWNYWTQHNQGRPIIFLGHSQGSLMLIRLLSDPKSHAQERMVSVIIPGGNVIAPRGKDVGGSFQHIPACRSTGQAGCVIAYSSYPEPPPPSLPGGSKFGRTSRTGMQVLCTNPASLQGGSATLAPDFRESPHPGKPPSAPWTEYPDLFRAQCMSALGATWLSVSKISQNDHRRQLHQTGGRDWGYHVYDINLVLGNLVQDVKAQEVTYCKTDHQGCGKSTATARSYRLAAVASRRSVGPGRASRAQRAVGARRDRGQ